MKRRVMIAKALSHEPDILFLDEPTAGVDVELRRDMWNLVRGLRARGVTIILTTHYIEEAEEMADRVGVINKGALILVEEKGRADEEVRQEAAHAAPAGADGAHPCRRSRPGAWSSRTGAASFVLTDRGLRRHGYSGAAAAHERARSIEIKDLQTHQSSLEEIFVKPGERAQTMSRDAWLRIEFNRHGVWAIYRFEIARALRTLVQSLVTPVITTSLYFVVFGAAIGSRMSAVDGVHYGAFIVPGLIMLALFTESLANASFGIFFPKFIGTIYELLSAPISYVEIVIAYVGAAASKSVVLGLVILATASLFVPIRILHPLLMIGFLVMTAVTFSLFGFILGLWARGWEQLQFIPMLVVTPLTFLGGAFYSISMLPPAWRTFSLFNPVVYLISGFRWCFYGMADVNVARELRHDHRLSRDLPRGRRMDIQDRIPPEELARFDGRSTQAVRDAYGPRDRVRRRPPRRGAGRPRHRASGKPTDRPPWLPAARPASRCPRRRAHAATGPT